VIAGERTGWLAPSQAVDVWDAKGFAQAVLARLLRREPDVRLAKEGDRPAALHPRGAAWLEFDGQRIGAIGPLHPDVADAFGISGPVVVVELNLVALEAVGERPLRFAPLPRFPASTRDLAIVVGNGVPAGEVERVVREAAGDLAEGVVLFDRFVGGVVPAGHASLGLRVVYRAADRTLTDAEIDERHGQVVLAVEKMFGATLRS
jgi:phenylalanyl-tRNA synthetase beta chain